MHVEVDLMGGFVVWVGPRAVPADEWRRRHAGSLVKLLALTPRHTLHREQVIDSLWPGIPVDDAAPRLHKAAHYARRSVGDPRAVVLRGESVSLFPDAEVEVDALIFERAAEAVVERRASQLDEERSAAAQVAELWRGELLPDDPYEPWLDEPRDRLHYLYVEVLRRAGLWTDLARVDPADLEASLAVARQLADSGDRRAALRQLERLEKALHRELGVRPDPEVDALRAALLALDAPGATPRRPAVRPPLGREAEQRRIDRLLVAATEGRGRTLFVSGPAGIGKTAILQWLDRRAEERGLRVGRGTAASIEGAWPYAPVMEALSDLCRRHPALLDGLSDDYRVEITQALRGSSAEWAGESRHQRLFVSVAELLRLAASGNGMVLVVDDMHEADEASLRLLHYVSRLAVTERIVVVVAHRPWPLRPGMDEMRRSLIGRGTSVPMELGPLADSDIRRLTGHASRADASVHDSIVRLAGGNPFMALELARSLRGADDLARPMGALVLRGLGPAALDAITRLAVLGEVFDTDEWVAMCGRNGESECYALLDEVLAAGAVEGTETGYRFRHALVRDR